MKKNLLPLILAGACIALLVPAVWGGDTPPRPVAKATLSPEALTGPPVQYQQANRRDPFLNPLLLKKADDDQDEEMPHTAAMPGISGMYIADVKLVGISVQDEARTAVFRGPDKRVYFLQEGDRLFDGFVKSIESDAVQFVRETKLKSGKTVIQDVNKRLRTP